MSKHLTSFVVVSFLAFAHGAFASDVSGRVTVGGLPATDDVVVWIDGALPDPVPKQHVVLAQSGIKFSPSFLVVVAGQTVDMPNDDNVAHNVYSISPAKKFNLGVYTNGETRSVTFEKPGLVELNCWLHKRMNAKILVVPNRFFARAEGGTYRISGIPAGRYRVVASRAGSEDVAKEAVVGASGAVTIDFGFEHHNEVKS
jgi:plastocyanin